ncbi:MAG: antirestriction protein ArdA [Cohaesibacteraceae bacterium]|nr:antirestriction protein ArdA [Cohaesibacteraceae bacterium]
MTQLFAQPYDTSATGFYFESREQFDELITKVRNHFGDPVEEFEIQFIDGDDLDCSLAHAWGINQSNIGKFFDVVNDWDERQKLHYIIAVGECSYDHDTVADDPENIDIVIYRLRSLRELAQEFVDDGLFGEVPKSIENYIDYDRIARDLAHEYSSTTIAGEFLLYQCA